MDIQDIFTYLHIRCYPDRYPHKISMFGYVTIHMDNIGYVMDISWKSVRISMQDICTRTFPFFVCPVIISHVAPW